MTAAPGTPPATMSRRLTFLFAVTAGAAIGNLYWTQPLLGLIAGDLGTATTAAGWLCCLALTVWARGRRGPLVVRVAGAVHLEQRRRQVQAPAGRH